MKPTRGKSDLPRGFPWPAALHMSPNESHIPPNKYNLVPAFVVVCPHRADGAWPEGGGRFHCEPLGKVQGLAPFPLLGVTLMTRIDYSQSYPDHVQTAADEDQQTMKGVICKILAKRRAKGKKKQKKKKKKRDGAEGGIRSGALKP